MTFECYSRSGHAGWDNILMFSIVFWVDNIFSELLWDFEVRRRRHLYSTIARFGVAYLSSVVETLFAKNIIRVEDYCCMWSHAGTDSQMVGFPCKSDQPVGEVRTCKKNATLTREKKPSVGFFLLFLLCSHCLFFFLLCVVLVSVLSLLVSLSLLYNAHIHISSGIFLYSVLHL